MPANETHNTDQHESHERFLGGSSLLVLLVGVAVVVAVFAIYIGFVGV